jgi:hypothetical protein
MNMSENVTMNPTVSYSSYTPIKKEVRWSLLMGGTSVRVENSKNYTNKMLE